MSDMEVLESMSWRRVIERMKRQLWLDRLINKYRVQLSQFPVTARARNFVPPEVSSTHSFSSSSINYTVKGVVGEHQVDALPDTGAKNNFISPRLVKKLRLIARANSKTSVQLPNGQKVRSPGTVEVPFSFSGERGGHLLECCILPTVTWDLILCQSFLEATNTLTTFARRVTKSLRSTTTQLQFNLLDNDRRCLWGRLSDLPASALADAGCDIMLISTQFATKHSLKIDRSVEHRRIIQYADGSVDTTIGLIRDVAWQFGGSEERVQCDFYVLDNLTVDAVLSSHFLFELDVFARFGNQMVDASPTSDFQLSDLYNIRLINGYSRELEALEHSCIADMNSPNASSREAIKAERVRRDQIRDAINDLPESEQDQARIDETNRQEIWDGRRCLHEHTSQANITANHQPYVVQKRYWWNRGVFRRRVE